MSKLSLAAALMLAATKLQAQAQAPQVFGPEHITDVYRVSLDRDALLLESINDVIKAKNIRDSQVIISSGSLQDCTHHVVASTAAKPQNENTPVKGPSAIPSQSGSSADAEARIHI